MGFLAPFAPAIIKGGIGIGSSLLGNLLGRAKPSAKENSVLNNAEAVQNTGLTQGKSLLDQGGAATQQPVNYWASLLSGNRGGITSAMGPELLRMGEGYQAAGRTSAALNPRGGPSSDFLSQLPFQQQRDVTSLLQGVRPEAAKSLFGAGNSLLSHGANLLTASTSAGKSILEQQQNMRELEAQRGGAIGKGIFDILQKYGPQIDDWFKSRGGGGQTDSVG